VQCYVTPRRSTIIADGIPGQQPTEARNGAGPRVGAPQQAIDGFLRAAGIGKIDECEIRDTGRGEFYFAVVERPGRPATAILPELLRAAIRRIALAEIDALPGGVAALGAARSSRSSLCSTARYCRSRWIGSGRPGDARHRFLSEGEDRRRECGRLREKLEASL